MNRIASGLLRPGWVGGVGVLIVAIAVVACSGSGSPTSPSSSVSASEVEFQLLRLTNGERDGAGVDPDLDSDTSLSNLARAHSNAMRDQGFVGHTGPDGRTLRQRLVEAGVDYSRAAENIAQVSNTANPASLAHELLMDSERHRANILDPRFHLVGIGVARSSDTFWITQIFVKP